MAGFFSGLLNTSTSIVEPPVILLVAGQGLPKDQFQRTLVSFLFASSLVATLTLVASGVITPQTAGYGVAAIPFALMGGGMWPTHRDHHEGLVGANVVEDERGKS